MQLVESLKFLPNCCTIYKQSKIKKLGCLVQFIDMGRIGLPSSERKFKLKERTKELRFSLMGGQ